MLWALTDGLKITPKVDRETIGLKISLVQMTFITLSMYPQRYLFYNDLGGHALTMDFTGIGRHQCTWWSSVSYEPFDL